MKAASSRLTLSAALLALSVLYQYWYRDDPQPLATLLVFVLPPLLLSILTWRGVRARFWAGVLALAWFSHGVMSAWTEPPTRLLAAAEIALALLVIAIGNWRGVRARFAHRQR